MRVVVLTTSWPRTEREFAGRFVADAVERLRERGVEVEVLAPGSGYPDYGLAYGLTAALVGTIVANFFYLTMQFYYFYAFLAFALALPVVFAGRARGRPG